MVEVGHRRLGTAAARPVDMVAGARAREAQDDIDPLRVEALDVAVNRIAVGAAGELGLEPAVAAQPAGFVERQSDRVDLPRLHRLDRPIRDRALEDAVAMAAVAVLAGAGVLR